MGEMPHWPMLLAWSVIPKLGFLFPCEHPVQSSRTIRDCEWLCAMQAMHHQTQAAAICRGPGPAAAPMVQRRTARCHQHLGRPSLLNSEMMAALSPYEEGLQCTCPHAQPPALYIQTPGKALELFTPAASVLYKAQNPKPLFACGCAVLAGKVQQTLEPSTHGYSRKPCI